MKDVKVIIRTLAFILDEMESQLSGQIKFTFYLFIYLRERECKQGQGKREKERERNRERISSRLHA